MKRRIKKGGWGVKRRWRCRIREGEREKRKQKYGM